MYSESSQGHTPDRLDRSEIEACRNSKARYELGVVMTIPGSGKRRGGAFRAEAG